MLGSIFEAAFNNALNATFCVSILALGAAAIAGAFLRSGPLPRLTKAAPGLLTAIGVLGTFVGILLGLMQFDVADITRSVPLLLDGMKTAFVTSVFGMGSGIAVKLVSEVVARPEVASEDKGVEDVLASLEALRAEAERTRTEHAASLEKVRAALTGDAESSLVTQLQRLRTDVTDEMKVSRKANTELVGTIAEEIRKISTTLTENTSKAIIEALERSIRDFNEKISEQFGENFKQFNTAVGRLLEWQENYRQQMIANAEALREGATGIQASRVGLEAIGMQATALVRAAADMQALLDGIGRTREELDQRLVAFRNMATAATAAMPTIQAKVEELTTGFSRQVEAATQQAASIGAALERTVQGIAGKAETMQRDQEALLTELSKGYARLREDAAAAGQDMRGAIQTASETLRTSLADAASEVQKASVDNIRSVTQQLQRTTDDEFRRIAASLDEQVKQLDKALTEELERTLSAMGSQLVSLTGKFVEDYSILTAQMREAVNATQRATT